MTTELITMGVILIVCSYLIGVKKYWQLLAGIQLKRAKDPEKVVNFLATMMVLVGALLVTTGVIGFQPAEAMITPCILVLLLALLYANVKMMR